MKKEHYNERICFEMQRQWFFVKRWENTIKCNSMNIFWMCFDYFQSVLYTNTFPLTYVCVLHHLSTLFLYLLPSYILFLNSTMTSFIDGKLERTQKIWWIAFQFNMTRTIFSERNNIIFYKDKRSSQETYLFFHWALDIKMKKE